MSKKQKIGRNDLCPCGSGKKYKNCCMEKDKAATILNNPMDGYEKVLKIMNSDGIKDSVGNKVWMPAEQYSEKLNKIRSAVLSYDAVNLKTEAEKRNSQALFYLGFAYFEGVDFEGGYLDGSLIDYAKAFKLFEDSAKEGNTLALAFTRMCLYYGIGTKADTDARDEYLDGRWKIDWDDELFSWEYYRRGYYERYVRSFYDYMEDFIIKMDSATPENERQELFLNSYAIVREDLLQILWNYFNQMNYGIGEINPDNITDEIIQSIGYKREDINLWKETHQYKEHKRRIADKLSVMIATSKYLFDVMDEILNNLYDILLDFELERSEKTRKVDICWVKYDFMRELSNQYLHHGVFDLNLFDYGTFYSLNYHDRKTNTIEHVSLCFDKLWGVAIPQDFRACRLFFDLYRFGRGFEYVEWAIIYTYHFIYRNFVLARPMDESVLLESFAAPVYYENEKISIDKVLSNTIKALDRCISDYDSINQGEIGDLSRSYSFIEAPTQLQVWEQNIGTSESRKSQLGICNNYIFAFSNTIPALDYIVEVLGYIFEREGYAKRGITVINDDLQLLYSETKRVRQQLIERVYRNAYIYDSDPDRKKLSIKEIEKTEAEIEKEMILCDSIDFFSDVLVKPEQIDELLTKKKRILDQLSSMHPKTLERLETSMDRASLAIRKVLTEGKYNSDYLEEIDSLLGESNCKEAYQRLRVFRTALASGEFLYHTYINGKNENIDFDYSFIAVQYYSALEALLKTLVYEPYIDLIESETNKKVLTQEELKRYLPEKNINFVTFKSNSMRELKPSSKIELGPIGNLLANSNKPDKFNDYFSDIMSATGAEIIQYGENILMVLEKRNKAAHGSETVSFVEAKAAKSTTFDKDEIKQYKGLILDFLNMLKRVS